MFQIEFHTLNGYFCHQKKIPFEHYDQLQFNIRQLYNMLCILQVVVMHLKLTLSHRMHILQSKRLKYIFRNIQNWTRKKFERRIERQQKSNNIITLIQLNRLNVERRGKKLNLII